MKMKDRIKRKEIKISNGNIVKRFMSHVIKTDFCWEWTGCLNNRGYATCFDQLSSNGAYVVSYKIFVGSISEGMDIDHICRNRKCVNPSHLEQVTRSENIKRMWDHRRKINDK